MNLDAFGTGLVSVQGRTQQATGYLFNVLNGANEFNTARLAAPAGMNLGLNDPWPAMPDFLGGFDGFLLRSDLNALGNRYAKLLEQFFCLIFMQIHVEYIPLLC